MDRGLKLTFYVDALIKAILANYLMLIPWRFFEYLQFGELQLNRHCDDVVWLLYLIILYIAFKPDKTFKKLNNGDFEIEIRMGAEK